MHKKLNKFKYYAINKPYGYLSQFTGEQNDKVLGDLFNFPKDVYPIGRLDKDSEGILLLTNDNKYKTKLLDPKSKKNKTYWVQVEGEIGDEAIHRLENGSIVIKHKGSAYKVNKATCKKIQANNIGERVPPIRERKSIPTSWIELTITEGKNRQVRKMTAAVGHPTLRLIRHNIEGFTIEQIGTGKVLEFQPFK